MDAVSLRPLLLKYYPGLLAIPELPLKITPVLVPVALPVTVGILTLRIVLLPKCGQDYYHQLQLVRIVRGAID